MTTWMASCSDSELGQRLEPLEHVPSREVGHDLVLQVLGKELLNGVGSFLEMECVGLASDIAPMPEIVFERVRVKLVEA